jgi:CheY-like chemotaxis protein
MSGGFFVPSLCSGHFEGGGSMRSVLLVEHDADRRLFLHHCLTKCGNRVVFVTNEAQARKALSERREEFDVFIASAALPGGRGIGLAMMARRRDLLSLVIFADGSGNGGRRIKVYAPGGLVYRGAVFGIGTVVDKLRDTSQSVSVASAEHEKHPA